MLDGFDCWATDCGQEISEEDRWTLHWELEARFCPWCGTPIEEDDSAAEELLREQRDDEAALRLEYWKAVM